MAGTKVAALREVLREIEAWQNNADPAGAIELIDDAREAIADILPEIERISEAARDMRAHLRTAEIGIKGAIEWAGKVIDESRPI